MVKQMKRSIHSVFATLRNAFVKWYRRDPFRESAAIAFCSVFSLPGLLVVVLALGGYFFGTDAISGHLHREITRVMGSDTADQVNEMILMPVLLMIFYKDKQPNKKSPGEREENLNEKI